MGFWRNLSGWQKASLAGAVGLVALALTLFFFDSALSARALPYRATAENETTRLGEFFQLTRLFGKADVLLLLGLLLGLAGWRRFFLRLALSLIVVGLLVHPLKALSGRERPDGSDRRSFPSGDAATAFVLPGALAVHPVLATAGTVAATGASVSRVFFQKHYPSDICTGAAVGLLAAVIGGVFFRLRRRWLPLLFRIVPRWLLRRDPYSAEEGRLSAARNWGWLPTQNMFLWATGIFLAAELLNALVDGHHRHIVQFLAWFGPVLALYICHCRLRPRYGRRIPAGGAFTHLTGAPFYFMIKRALAFSGVLGAALLILPWFLDASGMRLPAVSAGLLLMAYAWLTRRDWRSRRFAAVAADSAALLYIVQLYAAGYLLGIL